MRYTKILLKIIGTVQENARRFEKLRAFFEPRKAFWQLYFWLRARQSRGTDSGAQRFSSEIIEEYVISQ